MIGLKRVVIVSVVYLLFPLSNQSTSPVSNEHSTNESIHSTSSTNLSEESTQPQSTYHTPLATLGKQDFEEVFKIAKKLNELKDDAISSSLLLSESTSSKSFFPSTSTTDSNSIKSNYNSQYNNLQDQLTKEISVLIHNSITESTEKKEHISVVVVVGRKRSSSSNEITSLSKSIEKLKLSKSLPTIKMESRFKLDESTLKIPMESISTCNKENKNKSLEVENKKLDDSSNYDLSKDSEFINQLSKDTEEEGNNTRISTVIQSISLDTTVIPTYRERRERNSEEKNYPMTRQLSTYYKTIGIRNSTPVSANRKSNSTVESFFIQPVVNQDSQFTSTTLGDDREKIRKRQKLSIGCPIVLFAIALILGLFVAIKYYVNISK